MKPFRSEKATNAPIHRGSAEREEYLAKSKSIFFVRSSSRLQRKCEKNEKALLTSGFVIINYNQIAVLWQSLAKSVLPRLRLWSGFARPVRLIVCTCVSVAAVIKRNGT